MPWVFNKSSNYSANKLFKLKKTECFKSIFFFFEKKSYFAM